MAAATELAVNGIILKPLDSRVRVSAAKYVCSNHRLNVAPRRSKRECCLILSILSNIMLSYESCIFFLQGRSTFRLNRPPLIGRGTSVSKLAYQRTFRLLNEVKQAIFVPSAMQQDQTTYP